MGLARSARVIGMTEILPGNVSPLTHLLDPLGESQDWRQEGMCAQTDPDLFFPDRGDSRSRKLAKEICADCPVAQQCLDFALETDQEYGIWGGTTALDRRRIREAESRKRRRRRAS